MQSSSARLVCRAHNRFSQSAALLRHFLIPNPPLLQHGRHSSFITPAAQDGVTNDTKNPESPERTASEQPDVQPPTKQPPKLVVRRLHTDKGIFVRSKRTASKAKNIRERSAAQKESLSQTQQLLIATKNVYEEDGDYEGIVVKPKWSAPFTQEKYMPWCKDLVPGSEDAMDRLNREIELFHEYTKPNRFETIARKHLIEQIRSHVRKTHPNYVLEVFGSERTGTAFATSDIDLRLVHKSVFSDTTLDPITASKPPEKEARVALLYLLRQLFWANINKNPAYTNASIRYSRYPLIAIQDRKSGLDVQIVLSNNTSVSREYMGRYMEQYPYLRPLFSVVKTMFDIRGLSDAFYGGFGSYALFMMVVASIKHKPHSRNDAAGGLVNFLRFWGAFDTTAKGISVDPVELYDKETTEIMTPKVKDRIERGRNPPLPCFMLSLRDPADETNNLGRKGTAIKHIQVTTADLSQQLHRILKLNNRKSLLGPLVGPSYVLHKNHRSKLGQYGHGLYTEMQASFAATARAIRETEDAGTDVGSDAEPEPQDLMEGLPGMETDGK